MTLGDRLAAAAAALAAAGIDVPRREARLLMLHATGLDGAGLLRDLPSVQDVPGFDALVARRAAREPLAFITGHQPFWTLDVMVSPATLIPRADSEALIEAALAALPDRTRVGRILDIGTGTGCLLLAALTEFPSAWGVGTDRVPAAVSLARRNAVSFGLAGRCAFACGEWAAAIVAKFDLVLCNPPYIESTVIPTLMPEVARYEPGSALDGGRDGLDAYRAVIRALPRLLSPEGLAVLELGLGQADAAGQLATAQGLMVSGTGADLGGVPRALLIRNPS